MMARAGQLLLSADARVLEASDRALEMLGVTLDELRALPRGALSLAEDRAADLGFDEAWREGGRDPILGAGTIRLPDGRLLRVSYLITPLTEGSYDVILESTAESVAEPPRRYTIGSVLSAWRAAERQLATLTEDDVEWALVQDEVARFRAEYHRLAQGQRDVDAGAGGP